MPYTNRSARKQEIKLNYVDGDVITDPNPIFVQQGDTLTFVAGNTPDATVEVSITSPAHFSRGHFKSGDTHITVNSDLKEPVRFECALLVGGQRIPARPGKVTGGILEPERAPGSLQEN